MSDRAERQPAKAGSNQPTTQRQMQPSGHTERMQQLADHSPQALQLKQQTEAIAPPNRTGLPNQLKSGIESLSGMSMDHVRVHYNSAKPAQLQAHAYAQGSDIHVGPGQERHLPHEAWHVVQQAQGRVRPTLQMKSGVPVNDDKGLEAEADLMGSRAVGKGAALTQRFADMEMSVRHPEKLQHSNTLSSTPITQLDRVSTKIGNETVTADKNEDNTTLAFLEPGEDQKLAPVHLTKKIKKAGASLIAAGNLTHNALNAQKADVPDYHFTLTSGFMTSILMNSNISKYLTKHGKANAIWSIKNVTAQQLAQDKSIANDVVTAFNTDLGIAAGGTFDNLMFTYDPAGTGPTFDEVVAFHDAVVNDFFSIPSVNPGGDYPFKKIKYSHLKLNIVAAADTLAGLWRSWSDSTGAVVSRNNFRLAENKWSDLTKALNILSRIRAKAIKLKTSGAIPGVMFDENFIDNKIAALGTGHHAKNSIKQGINTHTLAKVGEF